jgi:ATP-dependent exoDNAse (exonuclease V) alpha subunit
MLSVLVVCGTHHEIATITAAVRERRRQAGELGEARQVTRDVPFGWTVAQKRDWRNFRAGQVLGFHRAVKGIDRGSTGEVVQADSGRYFGAAPQRSRTQADPQQAQAFEVFDRQTIEVAAGDQLLFTANHRGSGFQATSGEIVTVDRFDAHGRICLADGRMVPNDYVHLAHGYVITAHRSQGKSVDEVIVSAEGMNRELFYVAASRGRERVTVVTSDAAGLRESVSCTSARRPATELARAIW